MSWLRSGDNAPYDPRILATQAMPEADGPWFLNEVRGFIWTLSSTSAGFLTDYVLNMGVVYQAAGSAERAERLVTVCCRAGLMERVDVDGMPGVKLVEDPDFVHIRKKDEVEWDRQRKRDNSDPNLKGPVLLRDGDWCRYCRHEVHWTGRMSNRKATLDHLSPGTPGTVDTLVVACVTCNSARQDDEDGEWTRAHPLLPPPKRPVYGPWTRHYLTKRGLLPAPASPAAADSESKVDAPGPDQAGRAVRALGTPPVPQRPAAGRPQGLQGVHPGTADHGAPAGPSSQSAPPDGASEGRSPDGANPGADGGAGAEPRRRLHWGTARGAPEPARRPTRPGSGPPSDRPPRPAGPQPVCSESHPSPPRVPDSVRTQSELEGYGVRTPRDGTGLGRGGSGRGRDGTGPESGRDGTGGARRGRPRRRRKRR